MNSSMHHMKAVTVPKCSLSRRVQDVATVSNIWADAANFGAATGGFRTLDPHTTEQYHSLRERRT